MSRVGNSIYATNGNIDVSSDNIKVIGIICTGVGGAGVVDLQNNPSSPSTQIQVEAASGTTNYLDMSDTPVIFPNGIRVTAGANTEATVIIRETSGG